MDKPFARNAAIPILIRAQHALGKTQAGLGALLGASRKTIARRQTHAHQLSPREVSILATAIYPLDPGLAAEVAASGGETLASLGVVTPTSPAAPSLEHLVDAVVMAAVEAGGGFSPQLRAVLLAAFERAGAMGLGVAEVVNGLRGKSAEAR